MKKQLISMNACYEATEWIGDRNLEQAYAECTRADWLIWYAKQMNVSTQKLILASALCADTVRHLVTEENLKYLDTAILYGKGQATFEELCEVPAWIGCDTPVTTHASSAVVYIQFCDGDSAYQAALALPDPDYALEKMADIVRSVITLEDLKGGEQ